MDTSKFAEELLAHIDFADLTRQAEAPTPGSPPIGTDGKIAMAVCAAVGAVVGGGSSLLCNPDYSLKAGRAIISLLPKAWVAHGVPDVCRVPGDLWLNRAPNQFAPAPTDEPILRWWKSMSVGVQSFWDEARKYYKLPAAPFHVNNTLLVPSSAADRRSDVPVFGFSGTAEDALYHWLWQCRFGWDPAVQATPVPWPNEDGTFTTIAKTLDGILGNGRVTTGEYAGLVEDAVSWHGTYDKMHCGHGPFGITLTGNWTEKLTADLSGAGKLLGDAIVWVWKAQLVPLQLAVPQVLGAVHTQVLRDAGLDVTSNKTRADSLPTASSGPGVGTVLVGGGLLAGAGYAIWHFWPSIVRVFK